MVTFGEQIWLSNVKCSVNTVLYFKSESSKVKKVKQLHLVLNFHFSKWIIKG